MDQTTLVIPLDYGRPVSRRKIWVRRVCVLLSLAIVAVLVWQFGPGAWYRMQVVYWQSRCMNFELSPDQVVAEEDPVDLAPLLADSRMRMSTSVRINEQKHVQVGMDPPELDRLLTFLVPPSRPRLVPPVLFMHRMTQPDGQEKLVVLMDFFPDTMRMQISNLRVGVLTYVSTPGSFSSLPVMGQSASIRVLYNPRVDRHMRIYAGQVDPADPSHLTIRYRAWGQEDVMDGRLDNSGTVTLSPRKPPMPTTMPN